ncbi:MAG: hypothetical protein V7L20_05035 [Nostoc sp.]|uniref:hypothetical protein n=1 Tax=Nostoc sp. TaxID=1180 RepID=UPI002FFB054E
MSQVLTATLTELPINQNFYYILKCKKIFWYHPLLEEILGDWKSRLYKLDLSLYKKLVSESLSLSSSKNLKTLLGDKSTKFAFAGLKRVCEGRLRLCSSRLLV